MTFKVLENVTREQIEQMTTEQVIELGAKVNKEAEGEKIRQALLNVLNNAEKKIVESKVIS